MTKSKTNEFFKLMAIAVLCIGIFGAVFMGINSLALAAATEAEIIPLTTAAVDIPTSTNRQDDDTADTTTEYYQAAYAYDNTPHTALNIVLQEYTYQILPHAGAISAEEAVQIGARYIYDVYGECIDGLTVRMMYADPESTTRAIWLGLVAETLEDIKRGNHPLFAFTICADTGMRINIHAPDAVHPLPTGDFVTTSHLIYFIHPGAVDPELMEGLSDEMAEVLANMCVSELEAALSVTATAAQRGTYAQLAREYGERHFAYTEVVDVELLMVRHSGVFTFNEDGELVTTVGQFIFMVTDCTGRGAMILLMPNAPGHRLQGL